MPRPLSMWRASSLSVLAPREAETSMPGGFISPVQIKIKRAPTGLAPWEARPGKAFEGLLARYFG